MFHYRWRLKNHPLSSTPSSKMSPHRLHSTHVSFTSIATTTLIWKVIYYGLALKRRIIKIHTIKQNEKKINIQKYPQNKTEIDFPCMELKCETVFPTNKWQMKNVYFLPTLLWKFQKHILFYFLFFFKHRNMMIHIHDNTDITFKTQPLIHSTILSAFNHGQKRVFETKAAVIWQTASVMEFMYRCICVKKLC